MKKVTVSLIFIPTFIICIVILTCNYYLLHYKVTYDLENFSIQTLSINLRNVSAKYGKNTIHCKKLFLKVKNLFSLNVFAKIDSINIENDSINALAKENSIEYFHKTNMLKFHSKYIYIPNYSLKVNNLEMNSQNNIISGKFLISDKIILSKNSIIKSLLHIKCNDYIFFSIYNSNSPIIEFKSTNIITKFFTVKSFYSKLMVLDKNKNVLDVLCTVNKNSNINIHGVIFSFSPLNAYINCKLKNMNILDIYLKKLSTKNKLINFIFDITGISDNTIKSYDIKIKNGDIKINE